jgi:hypothetical protein
MGIALLPMNADFKDLDLEPINTTVQGLIFTIKF